MERGGVQIPEVAADPEAAAIYQAGSDALRFVAEHLPAAAFFVEAQQRGIPAAMLAAPEEVLSDPHFVARGFPVEIFHDDLGRSFVYPGPVFRAPASPWRVRGRAPHLDEHGETVRRAARGARRVMEKFERRVIVTGLGLSDIGRHLGRGGLDLALDAALGAIADAGLQRADIDGVASMPFGDRPPEEVVDALGLQLNWMGGANSGAQLGVVMNAAMAVASGLCRHVLVYRSVARLGGLLGSASGALPEPAGPWEWHVPFHEYSAVNLMAMQARRHMHEYGTSKEQLGWIALNARRHAARNEHAVLRAPMTMDDYLDAPDDQRSPRSPGLRPADRGRGRPRPLSGRNRPGLPQPARSPGGRGLRQSRHARLGAARRLPGHGCQRCRRADVGTDGPHAGGRRRRRALRRLLHPHLVVVRGVGFLSRRRGRRLRGRRPSGSTLVANCLSTPTAGSCLPDVSMGFGCSTRLCCSSGVRRESARSPVRRSQWLRPVGGSAVAASS